MDGKFEKKYGFRCCFCNQKILESATDLLIMYIFQNKDLEEGCKQYLYAHLNCLKEKIHQYFKGYLVVFEDGEDENEQKIKINR